MSLEVVEIMVWDFRIQLIQSNGEKLSFNNIGQVFEFGIVVSKFYLDFVVYVNFCFF